jgi:hypothetical protein
MRASSGTSSTLPFIPDASTSTPKAPASSDDQAQSFSDVLHQQGGDSTDVKTATTANTTTAAAATITPETSGAKKTTDFAILTPVVEKDAPDAIKPLTPTAGKPPTAPATGTTGAGQTPGISSGSNLSSMVIEAMLRISQMRTSASDAPAPSFATASKNLNPAPTSPAKASAPSGTPDVATLIAQISAFGAMPVTTAALTTNAAVPSTPMIAAASVTLNSDSVAKATALTGINLPTPISSKAVTPAATKEKKSPTATLEGSFLHASATSPNNDAKSIDLVGTAVTPINYQAANQSFTPQSNSQKNAPDSSAIAASSAIGTAPVEKKSTMTTELNVPEMITGMSTNAASRPSADVNILLSSNNDFEDAIKQVVHIAQLSDASSSRTPTRIAIELQTPPGAIVNVYVSKQNDQYRAQLSTNDPAALSWVQDKITSLRQSNDLGVEVKWLPAQMESNTLSASSSSSNESNLNWNRDGQNQNQQTADDRSQSRRQNAASTYDDVAETEADAFATSFETAGGVA